MARDYARGKKPNKKTKNTASSVRTLLTTIIAVAFVGGLWFLAQQPADQAAPTPKQTISTSKAQVIEPAPVADKQADDKNNFDFYSLLPESQVKPQAVEAYKSTPKDPNKKTKTLLQAGSFRHLKDAERMRAKLILLNLPNVVTEKTTASSGTIWYRVRVGPFANRSMLNKAEDTLTQNNIAPLRINRK
ncbi:MAG: SPOR domain-containing protein [Gammaproteobacteria bacterium]|jgi:cell division protein FtsN|nr:SPOR domain-containing protein [Gammaproteobacteria bacterium]MDP6164606.1 SPOR domain-containing protein [Gammaproteobacteria bacterium]